MVDRLIRVWFLIGWYPIGILQWHILLGWDILVINFAQFYISFLANSLLVLCLNYIINDKITLWNNSTRLKKHTKKKYKVIKTIIIILFVFITWVFAYAAVPNKFGFY